MTNMLFNTNAQAILSLVTCVPLHQLERVTEDFGLEGVSAIIVFNSYFFENHLKVGYIRHLDAIALRYFGENGRLMLRRYIKLGIYNVLGSGKIYPGNLYHVIQSYEEPCYYEIHRLDNLNEDNLKLDFSEMVNANNIILEKCLAEAEIDFPLYISSKISTDADINNIYKYVFFYLLHLKDCIGYTTDLSIIARCLEKKRKDVTRVLKKDNIVEFTADGQHFFIPQMRLLEGLPKYPSKRDLDEVRKNYDYRYIYNDFKNNEL